MAEGKPPTTQIDFSSEMSFIVSNSSSVPPIVSIASYPFPLFVLRNQYAMSISSRMDFNKREKIASIYSIFIYSLSSLFVRTHSTPLRPPYPDPAVRLCFLVGRGGEPKSSVSDMVNALAKKRFPCVGRCLHPHQILHRT